MRDEVTKPTEASSRSNLIRKRKDSPGSKTKRRISASNVFYTAAQVSEALEVNELTIYRMVKSGVLPCYSLGGSLRFRSEEIESFLKQHRIKPRPGDG